MELKIETTELLKVLSFMSEIMEDEENIKSEIGSENFENVMGCMSKINGSAIGLLMKNDYPFSLDSDNVKKVENITIFNGDGNITISIQSLRNAIGKEANEIIQKGISIQEGKKNINSTQNISKDNTDKNIQIKPKKEKKKSSSKSHKAEIPDLDNIEMTDIVISNPGKSIQVHNYIESQNKNLLSEKTSEVPKEAIEDTLGFKDDDFSMFQEPIQIKTVKKELNEEEKINISDLIMDVYTVSYKNEDHEKKYTIIVAPLWNSKNRRMPIPTFIFLKTGKSICVKCPKSQKRFSYQAILEDETFIIRGRWDNGFVSLVYPQNLKGYEMIIEKKQIRPENIEGIGHNITKLENGLNIHVIPLASQNTSIDTVGILACVEDPKNKKEGFIAGCSADKPYAEINYNGFNYIISASWQEKHLISNVSIQKEENETRQDSNFNV